MSSPDPSTMTLEQTLDAEKAAAQAIQTAYAAFTDAVTAALATLPSVQAYNPQVRTLGQGVLANISFQMGTQLTALIASYTPAPAVTPPAAS